MAMVAHMGAPELPRTWRPGLFPWRTPRGLGTCRTPLAGPESPSRRTSTGCMLADEMGRRLVEGKDPEAV